MKLSHSNVTADSLTRDVREADANSLNSLEQFAPSSRSNYSKSNSIATLFLSRTRLQSSRKSSNINVDFNPCRMLFRSFTRNKAFFRNLFTP